MCECTTRSAQRIESVRGLSDPAAKGAMVKGTRPAETILYYYQLVSLSCDVFPLLHIAKLPSSSAAIPLKTPVVASMRIVWLGYGHGVVGGSDNLLGKRGQDLLALGSVEGGDAGGLRNG